MQIGVIYPQTEMETDPGAVQQFAQTVEAMGFSHVLAFDHVVGANRASRPGQTLPYDLDSSFHEPLVLFSFMAARTTKLGFITGVLILTQRQSVLVAKQAACLDVLSGGRLRLGVGSGWNLAEYEALGMAFETRGARIEEQIAVMRALWTERTVDFRGKEHLIPDAGLNPLPVQRPIPVWFGGGGDRPHFGQTANLKVVRRIARIGDGWIQPKMPLPRAQELTEVFRGYWREYGRDPGSVGIEVRIDLSLATQGDWAEELKAWEGMGASHVSLSTMGDGLFGVDAHLERLKLFRDAAPAAS